MTRTMRAYDLGGVSHCLVALPWQPYETYLSGCLSSALSLIYTHIFFLHVQCWEPHSCCRACACLSNPTKVAQLSAVICVGLLLYAISGRHLSTLISCFHELFKWFLKIRLPICQLPCPCSQLCPDSICALYNYCAFCSCCTFYFYFILFLFGTLIVYFLGSLHACSQAWLLSHFDVISESLPVDVAVASPYESFNPLSESWRLVCLYFRVDMLFAFMNFALAAELHWFLVWTEVAWNGFPFPHIGCVFFKNKFT